MQHPGNDSFLSHFTDLALDLQGLENWVNRIETTLQPRSLSPSLSLQQLQDMLKEHQVIINVAQRYHVVVL